MVIKRFIPLFLIICLLTACLPDENNNIPAVRATATPSPEGIVTDTPVTQTIDYLYEIGWSDGDKADDSISIFYSSEEDVSNAHLIVKDIPGEEPENIYFWNTAGVPDGDYYVFVMRENGQQASQLKKIGPVRIRHDLSCIDVSNRANLLPNSSFEEGTVSLTGDNHIIGWQFNRSGGSAQSNRVSAPSQAHSGQRAIRFGKTFNAVNIRSARRDPLMLRSQIIDLPTPGGKYLFSAWVKVQDVEPGHVLFQFRYYDRDGKQLKLQGHNDDAFYAWNHGTTDWTQVVYLLNVPHWDSPPYSENARAEKVDVGFTLDHSPGRLWVDDVSLYEISDEEYELFFPGNHFPAPEILKADTAITLPKKEGWATSIQQDPNTGIWWIVSPEQEAFWGLGVNMGTNEKIGAVTGLEYVDYRNHAQYQSRSDLNFNVGWRRFDGQDIDETTENFIIWMNFSSAATIEAAPEAWVLKDRRGNLIGDLGHYFPDVFSPIWQEHALEEAQALTKGGGWSLEREKVLGYWTDNEFSYGDLSDYIWGDIAKLAFVDWLQGKNDLPSVDEVFMNEGLSIDINVPEGFEINTPYETIDQLNESWSSKYHRYHYDAFEDVYHLDKPFLRSHDDPVRLDLYAFERVIYKIYVDTVVDNIRKVESDYMSTEGKGYHRPIFSNRFHLQSPAALESLRRNMDIFNRFDAIAVNLYPTFNHAGTYLPYELMQIVKSTFHDTTGLPICVAEFGVASEDADNYDVEPYLTVERWRIKTVPSEYQRGWAYRNLISTWANLPWVIGANWFSWFNGYGIPHGSDVRNSGLVDDNNNYYPHLANDVRSVNDSVNHILRSPNFTLENIKWEQIDARICQ